MPTTQPWYGGVFFVFLFIYVVFGLLELSNNKNTETRYILYVIKSLTLTFTQPSKCWSIRESTDWTVFCSFFVKHSHNVLVQKSSVLSELKIYKTESGREREREEMAVVGGAVAVVVDDIKTSLTLKRNKINELLQ